MRNCYCHHSEELISNFIDTGCGSLAPNTPSRFDPVKFTARSLIRVFSCSCATGRPAGSRSPRRADQSRYPSRRGRDLREYIAVSHPPAQPARTGSAREMLPLESGSAPPSRQRPMRKTPLRAPPCEDPSPYAPSSPSEDAPA